ncbi:MAG TPA: hypothetical protein VMP01_26670 [Pirellulaceae bacterium]|nr:hypothetical protein [Pirellulaceae bacterium]
MSHSPHYLDGSINDGHKLRIEFFKVEDRFAHRLSAVLVDEAGGETIVPLAESVEGASDDPWPPSPPLQSLSMEELADGRTAALLVGMAGRSHWSASVEFERTSIKPPSFALMFQLACRYSTVPTSLGSTYRVASGIRLSERKGFVGLQHIDAGIVAVFQGFSGPQWTRPVLNLDAGEFEMPAEKPAPLATAQWRYCVFPRKVDPAELRKRGASAEY